MELAQAGLLYILPAVTCPYTEPGAYGTSYKDCKSGYELPSYMCKVWAIKETC